MGLSYRVLIGLLSLGLICGTVGLLLPTPSQADVEFGGIKKILKNIFPPCGPGTRDQRFVVSKDGLSVCDNETGLWWEQSPSQERFVWGPEQTIGTGVPNAIEHCANLELTGKHHKKKQWRLPEVKELISLVDYSVLQQAANLNAPNGPFMNVQGNFYWSASEVAGFLPPAWIVSFINGDVSLLLKTSGFPAWCVSGDKDAH